MLVNASRCDLLIRWLGISPPVRNSLARKRPGVRISSAPQCRDVPSIEERALSEMIAVFFTKTYSRVLTPISPSWTLLSLGGQTF